jgi:hypothetical protein
MKIYEVPKPLGTLRVDLIENRINVITFDVAFLIFPKVSSYVPLQIVFSIPGQFQLEAPEDCKLRIGFTENDSFETLPGEPHFHISPFFIFLPNKSIWQCISEGHMIQSKGE